MCRENGINNIYLMGIVGRLGPQVQFPPGTRSPLSWSKNYIINDHQTRIIQLHLCQESIGFVWFLYR
jgi:hypothetical protein